MLSDNKPVPAYLQLGYIDNCIEQTMLWINGKSVHKNEECTVDFSCCYPKLLMDYDYRLKHGTEKLEELHKRRLVALGEEPC